MIQKLKFKLKIIYWWIVQVPLKDTNTNWVKKVRLDFQEDRFFPSFYVTSIYFISTNSDRFLMYYPLDDKAYFKDNKDFIRRFISI